MDICKFTKITSEVYKINRNNFENITNRDGKYIKQNKEGKNQYYAYCPECNNPVVLVNLFVTQDKNGFPAKVYGKHSVIGNPFDTFDEKKYQTCPLRKDNQISFGEGAKHNDKEFAKKIQKIILDNACKIRYFLSKIIGIQISDKLFINYIQEFHKSQGYYYKGLTVGNLPYLILYLSNQKSIQWQHLRKGCRERIKIEKRLKFFILNEKRQIELKYEYKKEKFPPNIVTVFKKHAFNANSEQDFIFQVFEKFNKKEYLIVEKKINFDLSYFYNLIKYKNKNKACSLIKDIERILYTK